MVNINPKTLGGKPELVAVFGCDRRVVSSSCGAYLTPGDSKLVCGGLHCGEHSGGNWIACQPCRSLCSRVRCAVASVTFAVYYSAAFTSGLGRLRASLKTVTWLILPVVICLSQRLSHACLSISNLYRETANGSLNQLSFI